LDANGAWDRRSAQKWLERCAERPVEFVEQPAAPDDVDTLLGLADDYPVTLALDESVTGLAAAREWLGRGWRGVFVIKPALAGPLDELAAWAAQTKADIVLSSAIETALGRAAILRFVFAHELTKRALGFGVGEIFGARLWDGPMVGPLLDAGWCDGVDTEELWNALN
jgi:O-succinylbenzoate synthase